MGVSITKVDLSNTLHEVIPDITAEVSSLIFNLKCPDIAHQHENAEIYLQIQGADNIEYTLTNACSEFEKVIDNKLSTSEKHKLKKKIFSLEDKKKQQTETLNELEKCLLSLDAMGVAWEIADDTFWNVCLEHCRKIDSQIYHFDNTRRDIADLKTETISTLKQQYNVRDAKVHLIKYLALKRFYHALSAAYL